MTSIKGRSVAVSPQLGFCFIELLHVIYIASEVPKLPGPESREPNDQSDAPRRGLGNHFRGGVNISEVGAGPEEGRAPPSDIYSARPLPPLVGAL